MTAGKHVTGRSDRVWTPIASAPEDSPQAEWAADHSWDRPDWSVEELVAAKRGRTVSVVLPALNEEDTVADVIASIRPLVGTLVDELVVLDSGSTDATAERARAAGAQVITREEAVPEVEPVRV